MLFDVYGPDAGFQWLGWVIVFVALILINEFARRSKAGGIICFIIVPAVLTVYFIAVTAGAASGAEWALDNPTVVYQNSWFHYAKLYAATIGCIGFMAIKFSWGKLGRAEAFKVFPFVIVAINILIAVVSDFESAIRAWNSTWISSEGVLLHGGIFNVLNGFAGLINILCMTGWFGIYISKKRHDMLWPDMTLVFIVAYDLWNFCYTYNCLPTHSWYCGLALLLAPTVAEIFWNKGGWIQNRAFTLAIWCMWQQTYPLFADSAPFAVDSVNNPAVNTVVASIALAANIIAFAYILYRSKKLSRNPWLNEIFVGTKDFRAAMARRATPAELAATMPGHGQPIVEDIDNGFPTEQATVAVEAYDKGTLQSLIAMQEATLFGKDSDANAGDSSDSGSSSGAGGKAA